MFVCVCGGREGIVYSKLSRTMPTVIHLYSSTISILWFLHQKCKWISTDIFLDNLLDFLPSGTTFFFFSLLLVYYFAKLKSAGAVIPIFPVLWFLASTLSATDNTQKLLQRRKSTLGKQNLTLTNQGQEEKNVLWQQAPDLIWLIKWKQQEEETKKKLWIIGVVYLSLLLSYVEQEKLSVSS